MSKMRYFFYPRADEVLQSDSAVVPSYNGEEGVEVSYLEYTAHVSRINAKILDQYNKLVAKQLDDADKIMRQKDAILERLGLTPEERELFK